MSDRPMSLDKDINQWVSSGWKLDMYGIFVWHCN